MSRAEERRKARTKRGVGHHRGRHPAWIVLASVVAALLIVGTVSQVQSVSDHHPTPRAPELASDVLPNTRYEGYPRVAEVYRMAAAVPAVLDGVYCYCRCSEHSGHYSLLDCFASDHASACDLCLSEAAVAYNMNGEGAGLDEIRDAVDRTYGT